eukprot:SRR837773.27797.p1 GENE.SRR837773.27797~~SRR837773.27797.p1  ORF type:complete len:482 (-),score=146.18 SRR837773.27797:54-1304(-)
MNQFELLRFRLPRHIEVLGIDENEHDMPKQLEDFLEVLKHLVQALSQPSPSAESVREAAILASQRITFPTVMSQFRREQLKKMKGLSLRIKDIKLTGLEPGCAVYCSSQVVMLDAEGQEDMKSGLRKHAFEYYAPRWTQAAQGPEAVWADELEFPDFYVPPLTEDSMCVTFLITKAAKDSKKFVLGTVQVPFKSLPWVHQEDGGNGHLEASVDAPLLAVAAGSGAADARLTATISMSQHRRQGEESAVPASPKRASTVMRLMAGSTTSSEHRNARGEREDSTDMQLTTQTFASLRQQFMGEVGAAAGRGGRAGCPDRRRGPGSAGGRADAAAGGAEPAGRALQRAAAGAAGLPDGRGDLRAPAGLGLVLAAAGSNTSEFLFVWRTAAPLWAERCRREALRPPRPLGAWTAVPPVAL